jgi:hypothetical protein
MDRKVTGIGSSGAAGTSVAAGASVALGVQLVSSMVAIIARTRELLTTVFIFILLFIAFIDDDLLIVLLELKIRFMFR